MGDFERRYVCVITSFDTRDDSLPSHSRYFNIIKMLTENGIDVLLLSNIYSLPCSSEKVEIVDHLYRNDNLKKPHSTKWSRRIRKIGALVWNLSFYIKVRSLLASLDGKIVVYYYPATELSLSFVILLLEKLVKRFKIFVDVNELCSAIIENDVSASKNYNITLSLKERFYDLYRRVAFPLIDRLHGYYDGMIVISTKLEEHFSSRNQHILRIPILLSLDNVRLAAPLQYDVGEEFRLGFCGQILLEKENIRGLFEAISIVKQSGVNCFLNLYGKLFEQEKELVLSTLPEKYGISSNVKYHGVLTKADLARELTRQHLLVLPRRQNRQTQYAFATKLGDYILAGVPILMTDVSDNSLYFKDGYNAYLVPGGDITKMAEKILTAAREYNKIAGILATNGLKTARENFECTVYSRSMESFLFGEDERNS